MYVFFANWIHLHFLYRCKNHINFGGDLKVVLVKKRGGEKPEVSVVAS